VRNYVSHFADCRNGISGRFRAYLRGLIDDVRIYSRALSAAEIQAMYDGGK
jgi:Concanavalin A-like lectin/glucanases superfamily